VWDGYVDKCNRLWWTNFLFVNNLIPEDGSETDGCFYWAWYLALDLQFAMFITVPVLLMYFKSPRLARTAVVCSIVVSCSAAFVYSMTTGISANSFDGLPVIQ
jgi:peptidoglycan/LPS O-acetylase OafA/YrhL